MFLVQLQRFSFFRNLPVFATPSKTIIGSGKEYFSKNCQNAKNEKNKFKILSVDQLCTSFHSATCLMTVT